MRKSGIKTGLQFVTKHCTGCRQHETISRMAASGTTILRGKALLASTETTGSDTIESLPLPWPPAGVSAREARRPHGHRCIVCSENYRCAGPDSSGECAPLCGPCLWVELGTQVRLYQSMADTIDRRRRKIEQQVGSSKCRKAQSHRGSPLEVSNGRAGAGGGRRKRR